jgi:Lon protease-like protein
MSTRIPIFPLEVVLFPGLPLPLHIFEARYKLMIQECLTDRTEFGVVLMLPDGLARVACAAKITEVLKKYADGRLDILTYGTTRFQIADVFRDKAYFEAAAEFLPDVEELAHQKPDPVLLALFQHCQTLLFGQIGDTPDEADPVSLAYRMAAQLPVDLRFRQQLLEVRSEAQRRAVLTHKLELLVPALLELEQRRRSEKGNARPPN